MKVLSLNGAMRKSAVGASASSHTEKVAADLSRSPSTRRPRYQRAIVSATAFTSQEAITPSRVMNVTARTSSGKPGRKASR